MNIRTSIIVVGATLALVTPAVASARAIVNQKGDTYFTSKHGSHALASATSFVSENGSYMVVAGKKARHTNVRTKAVAKTSLSIVKPDVIYGAPFGPTSIVAPGYIYAPGPVAGSSTFVDPNECQDNGDNCTDAQLCQYWGENCDSMAADTPAPATTASDTGH